MAFNLVSRRSTIYAGQEPRQLTRAAPTADGVCDARPDGYASCAASGRLDG